MVRRPFYKLTGWIFVILAGLGVLLPVLPTTPLLLVAAACFARSSEKWHQWLLRNRVFGPMIKNWDDNRCVSLPAKLIAVTMIVLFGGYSVFFVLSEIFLQIITGSLLVIGLWFVLRIKLCK